MNRTFATFAQPETFVATTGGGGDILVGRKVANTSFIRALLNYGTFDKYCFLIGENSDLDGINMLLEGQDPAIIERIVVRNVLELPDALARGEISVLHQNSHADQMGTVLSLRDRYAKRAVPVTGQIHSLSYPIMVGLLLAAGPIALGELERQLAEKLYPQTPWRASLLVAWLVKLGLLESAD